MTDVPAGRIATDIHTNAEAAARLRKRYRSEALFKSLGMGAVLLAALFLVFFLTTIVREAVPGFFQNYVTLPIELRGEDFGGGPTATVSPQERAKAIGEANFDGIVGTALRSYFPSVTDRNERRSLSNIISSGAPSILRRDLTANLDWIGTTQQYQAPLDDMADLYIKGRISETATTPGRGEIGVSGTRGTVQLNSTVNNFEPLLADVKRQLQFVADRVARELEGKRRVLAAIERDLVSLRTSSPTSAADRARIEGRIEQETRQVAATNAEIVSLTERLSGLQRRIGAADQRERLDNTVSSYFVRVNGGWIKLTEVQSANATGTVILPPTSTNPASTGQWQIFRVVLPESNRRIADREIVYLEHLRERGLIEQRLSREFFWGGASREPELAGVWVAIVGSFITLLITLGLSFPIGVAAAIYLEEFAPKNRITEIIEVNINNLAAVPSIIFGLLGLAVFLNWFDMPRSAPVVGGLVLALMTLPIIIIASRAAIRAVPPSVREAALGLGASHQQAVFHHVLPLAMPGILTGTILGMAHALGETAPLLMIGMVAFVVDMPKGITDAATLLPVQIFMWADFPEPAFQNKTAAAIVILLLFLMAMNAIAVILRKRFERRW